LTILNKNLPYHLLKNLEESFEELGGPLVDVDIVIWIGALRTDLIL